MTIREREVNERYITFSGPGKSETRGSQRIAIPAHIQVEEGQDVVVSINGYGVVYNCVKEEWFNNQDGTWNLNYILKSLTE